MPHATYCVCCTLCNPPPRNVPIPVSENASDTAENAGIGISKYSSPAQIQY